jgi:hypothetical protein
MPVPRIPRTVSQGKRKSNPRKQAGHLAFIRALPCAACGTAAPSEAAHVRTGTDGGIGIKPSDRHTLPLCPADHQRQHKIGETSFWSELGIDPLDVSYRLWTISGDTKAGIRIIFRAGQHIALKRTV